MDILKILIDIWAEQHGVEIKEIKEENHGRKNPSNSQAAG